MLSYEAISKGETAFPWIDLLVEFGAFDIAPIAGSKALTKYEIDHDPAEIC